MKQFLPSSILHPVKKHLVLVSVVGALLLAGFVFLRLLLAEHESFPLLKRGSYLGWFSGAVFGEASSPVYFSIEPTEDGGLQAAIYRAGWELKPVPMQVDGAQGELHPLLVSGAEGLLRFGGNVIDDNYAQGTVLHTATGAATPWVLFRNQETEGGEGARSGLKVMDHVISLRAEQSSLKAQVQHFREAIESAQSEQLRLSSILEQGDTLKNKAETRLTAQQQEIERLKSETSTAQKKLERLQSALQIARSVTPRGRITTLARESLIQEFRAIDFRLTVDSRKNDAAFVADFNKAREALALQAELDSYSHFERTELQ